MDELIKNICEVRNGTFTKETSSWFNGRAYFPLHSYELVYDYLGWTFELSSEWRVSERVHSNENARHIKVSVYLWSVRVRKSGLKQAYQFLIERTGWAKRLISKQEITIESTINSLVTSFGRMQEIVHWFEKGDYPLRNTFECTTKKDETVIFTTFDTPFDASIKINGALQILEQMCLEIEELEKG